MSVRIITGDCRNILLTLPPDCFDCCVTSPPYFGLRDYGVDGQIGLEPTLDAYLAELVAVCGEVRRVLKPSGTFWLNIGDSYAGSWGAQGRRDSVSDDASWRGSQIRNHPKRATNTGSVKSSGLKPKDLMLVPARVALALQADGWWVRSEIVWAKPNPMPESVRDRPTSAHEKIWLLTKHSEYYFDGAAVREDRKSNENARMFRGGCYVGGNIDNSGTGKRQIVGNDLVPEAAGRNVRNVWTMATQSFAEAHFATFPPELAERCIKAGCPIGGHVLDPFGGAGTSGVVADRLQRNATLIEINPDYARMARARIDRDAPLFSEAAV